MKRLFSIIVVALCITSSFAQREVMYNINIDNFSDSDSSGRGDIKGIREKLNDLQYLGVTTIVLSPVYEADEHFAAIGDLDKISSEFGNFKEYRDLIQEVHNRKMKLYQTVNLQYINTNHLWFKESFKNTKSIYSDYIYYADNKNEKPVFGINTNEHIVAVNLKNAKVAAYYNKALKYWTDPDGNGVFYDGVDGFIFKDIQDETDATAKSGNLLKEFWQPVLAMLKKINPKIQIITKPANNASSEYSLYTNSGSDGVQSYKLQEGIRSLNKASIIIAADSVFSTVPTGKYPVVYLEDEHSSRLGSLPKIDVGKLRVYAALNLLIGGIPVLYNGQEIALNNKTANIFKGTLLQEQQKYKNSVWNFYKELIKIKLYPALAVGAYKNLHNSNDKVISFLRIADNDKTNGKEVMLVMINLTAEKQFVTLDRDENLKIHKLKLVLGTPNIAFPKGGSSIEMTSYSTQVWTMLP